MGAQAAHKPWQFDKNGTPQKRTTMAYHDELAHRELLGEGNTEHASACTTRVDWSNQEGWGSRAVTGAFGNGVPNKAHLRKKPGKGH